MTPEQDLMYLSGEAMNERRQMKFKTLGEANKFIRSLTSGNR